LALARLHHRNYQLLFPLIPMRILWKIRQVSNLLLEPRRRTEWKNDLIEGALPMYMTEERGDEEVVG
jgi:hypothetical protein